MMKRPIRTLVICQRGPSGRDEQQRAVLYSTCDLVSPLELSVPESGLDASERAEVELRARLDLGGMGAKLTAKEAEGRAKVGAIGELEVRPGEASYVFGDL